MRPIFLLIGLAAGCGDELRTLGGEDLAISVEDQAEPPDLAPAACPDFVLLCDDFESHDFSKWDFTTASVLNADNLVVDSTRPYAGRYSAHSSCRSTNIAPSSAAYAARLWDPGFSTGVVAVRAYLFMPSAPAGVTRLFALTTRADGGAGEVAVGVDSGRWFVADAAGSIHYATSGLAAAAWSCVEAQLDLDAGVARLLVDGKPLITADASVTAPGGWTETDVGLLDSPSTVSQDLFVDDVAVATQPIGCL